MEKPKNPYRKGSIRWSVMEGDWEDLNAEQIAEVLCTTYEAVINALVIIKRDTGYCVPHAIRRAGRKKEE